MLLLVRLVVVVCRLASRRLWGASAPPLRRWRWRWPHGWPGGFARRDDAAGVRNSPLPKSLGCVEQTQQQIKVEWAFLLLPECVMGRFFLHT